MHAGGSSHGIEGGILTNDDGPWAEKRAWSSWEEVSKPLPTYHLKSRAWERCKLSGSVAEELRPTSGFTHLSTHAAQPLLAL